MIFNILYIFCGQPLGPHCRAFDALQCAMDPTLRTAAINYSINHYYYQYLSWDLNP